MSAKTPAQVRHKCAQCGRRLKPGRWITGRDRRILGGKIPRYCWPGEGCNR